MYKTLIAMITIQQINPQRACGYPKIVEIKPTVQYKANAKDPNYDNPISALSKDYSEPVTGKLIFKVRPNG